MIWSELLLIFLVGCAILWWSWRLACPVKKMWVVEPGWATDGRKFIILAANEKEADHIFMRHVCGWNKIFADERSHATFREVKEDSAGVIVVP